MTLTEQGCNLIREHELLTFSDTIYKQTQPVSPDRAHWQLELCAFALKGEHNVYSLVSNIPVCKYIDQR